MRLPWTGPVVDVAHVVVLDPATGAPRCIWLSHDAYCVWPRRFPMTRTVVCHAGRYAFPSTNSGPFRRRNEYGAAGPVPFDWSVFNLRGGMPDRRVLKDKSYLTLHGQDSGQSTSQIIVQKVTVNLNICDMIAYTQKWEKEMPWRYLHRSSHGGVNSVSGFWTFVVKGQGPFAAALALNVLWFSILAWMANLVVIGLR